MRELSVYIHIPFCARKCLYCDFLSREPQSGEILRYTEALVSEINQKINGEIQGINYSGFVVKTVFIGGGTPSVIDADCVVRIVDSLRNSFERAGKGSYEPVEVTIECNPGTVDYNKLAAYRKCGINRISFGLQSADDKELAMLGRIHRFSDWKEAVEMAREAGFDNINTDIISGLPNQDRNSFAGTLNKVMDAGMEHISVYSLIIEEGTPFHELYNPENMPEEEYDKWEAEDRAIYDMTCGMLGDRGYNRYEISNYSLPGYECRHNLVYWNRGDYLGFGVGAASMVDNIRFRNHTDIGRYMEKDFSYEDIIKIDAKEQFNEHIMLGLRKTEGISISETAQIYNVDLIKECGGIINKWVGEGMVSLDGGRLRCTEKGLSVCNRIIVDFISVGDWTPTEINAPR